jgi:adenylyl-sulfate kinase
MSNRIGFTLWFTGLSGAGKSTLAEALSARMKALDLAHEILDGDVVRTNLSKGLGFSKEDRDTNIRRIGFVANLLTRHGVPVITAAISPYKAIREECRAMIGPERFVEVHVHAPLDTLVERDVKGLYKKAIAGEIQNFTGVSDPYEAPENPAVFVDSSIEKVEDSLEKIWNHLVTAGLIPQPKPATTRPARSTGSRQAKAGNAKKKATKKATKARPAKAGKAKKQLAKKTAKKKRK